MTSLLAQLAFSNLVLSALLAVLASLVHRRGRYPALAHALWVLVLLKVVTPPIVVLPLLPGPDQAVTGDPSGTPAIAAATGLSVWEALGGWLAGPGTSLLILAWAIGSGLVPYLHAPDRAFDRLVRGTSTQALMSSTARGGATGSRSVPTIARRAPPLLTHRAGPPGVISARSSARSRLRCWSRHEPHEAVRHRPLAGWPPVWPSAEPPSCGGPAATCASPRRLL
jgi:hypothetical protein